MSIGGKYTKLVLDPNIDVDERPLYLIEKGPTYCRYNQNISTSYSTSNVNFAVVAPNRLTGVDKRMFVDCDMIFTFAGDAGAGNVLMPTVTYNGVQYLAGETDALRWMPLQSVSNSLTLQFNQTNVSQYTKDYFEPISRIGFSHDYEDHELSVGPSMHDQFQEFGDWTLWGSARNPLAAYGENSAQQPRGGLRLEVLTNTQFAATIRAKWSEPILMSPLVLGKMQQKAFLGLQNINIIFGLGDLSRMWCHDAVNNPVLSGPPTVAWASAPVLRLRFLTIPLIEKIPQLNLYPYCELVSYSTDSGTSLAPGLSYQLAGNNTQLTSIPKRVILFVRERDNDRNYTRPDCYARINNIQINWDNKNDLLASALPRDLYRMSVEAGLKMSWSQWNDFAGSIVVVDFASQIGLDDLQAPGMHGNYQIQINCNFTNIGSRAVNYTFYMVVVYEGIFSVDGTLTEIRVGDVVPRDVLDGVQMSHIEKMPFHEAYDYCGGSFWSSLKKAASKAAQGIKKGVEFAVQHAPQAAELIGKYGPRALEAAAMLGLGDEQMTLEDRALYRASTGSGLTGGRRMPRSRLRNRMN